MAIRTISEGITEIEIPDKNHYGYFVRLARKGKHYRKFFSYKRHGGKAKARKAAKEYYKELHAALPPRHPGTKDIKTVRNRSGKVGVHLARVLSKRWPNSESWAYVAGWRESGKHVHVSFAIGKYGDRVAWRLACIARDNQLRNRDLIEQIFQNEKRGKAVK